MTTTFAVSGVARGGLGRWPPGHTLCTRVCALRALSHLPCFTQNFRKEMEGLSLHGPDDLDKCIAVGL